MLQKMAQEPQGNKGCETADQSTSSTSRLLARGLLSTGFLQQNQRYKEGHKVCVCCKQKEGNLAIARLYWNLPLYTLRSVTQNFVLKLFQNFHHTKAAEQ